MQFCLAEESRRKIPWRNGEGKEKMKEILAIFPSCSDHLELHSIKHSQKNFREECIFKYAMWLCIYSTAVMCTCMYVCEGADVFLALKCLPVTKLNFYSQSFLERCF